MTSMRERPMVLRSTAASVASLRASEPWQRDPSRGRSGAGPGARATAYFAAKRALDIAGSFVLAVVFAPLMLLIVVLVRRDGGPVIYRHWRIGRAASKDPIR